MEDRGTAEDDEVRARIEHALCVRRRAERPGRPERHGPPLEIQNQGRSERPWQASSCGSSRQFHRARSRQSTSPVSTRPWTSSSTSRSSGPKRSHAEQEVGAAARVAPEDDLEEDPRPALRAAGPAFLPPVRLGVGELAEPGAVEGGGDEGLHYLLDLRTGARPGPERLLHGRTGRRLADELRRRARARTVQLRHGHGPAFVQGPGQAREPRQVLAPEDPELTREALARGLHARGAGPDHAEAAVGPEREPVLLRPRARAVVVAPAVGEGRQRDAVRHGGTALEVDGLEQAGQGGAFRPPRTGAQGSRGRPRPGEPAPAQTLRTGAGPGQTRGASSSSRFSTSCSPAVRTFTLRSILTMRPSGSM